MNLFDPSFASESIHVDIVTLDEIRTCGAAPSEQAHLDACAECRNELEQLRQLARDLKSQVRPLAVPAEVDRAILRPRGGIAWLPLAAAAALLVAFIAALLSSRPPEDVNLDGHVDVVDAYLMAKRGEDATGLLKSIVIVGLTVLPDQRGDVRFSAMDLYIDSGKEPLAAWQVEISTTAKVVGIEGGDGVFASPPTYDPAALAGGRVVLAGLTLDEKPPSGRVLVARLHLQESGATVYTPKLIATSGQGGKKIFATIEIGEPK